MLEECHIPKTQSSGWANCLWPVVINSFLQPAALHDALSLGLMKKNSCMKSTKHQKHSKTITVYPKKVSHSHPTTASTLQPASASASNPKHPISPSAEHDTTHCPCDSWPSRNALPPSCRSAMNWTMRILILLLLLRRAASPSVWRRCTRC